MNTIIKLSKELINAIGKSERKIKKGEFVKADTKMSNREIDKLLMS